MDTLVVIFWMGQNYFFILFTLQEFLYVACPCFKLIMIKVVFLFTIAVC